MIDQYMRDFQATGIQSLTVSSMMCSQNRTYLILLHQKIRSATKNFDEMNIRIYEFEKNLDLLISTETWQIK